ncbi:hypothetical protein TCDM_11025 [Trypanosoma cruzi Dm28c]|uniref:Uncharacterized protein n=1 Tax=Trypanosoma cruzi Dm28c TaxID=1416333 RepID=V5D1P2_TRYCR|nr:hypothetical protein TCDM_11025 [Trypanosoma cruzi Dm28c]
MSFQHHTHTPSIYTKALLEVLQRELHSLLFVQFPKVGVSVCVEHPQHLSWLCDSQKCTVRSASFTPIKGILLTPACASQIATVATRENS